MRCSHLMLALPTQPGTNARSGKPWSRGRVPPFMPQASSVSGSVAFATGSTRRNPASGESMSMPISITLTALLVMPAALSTYASGTPIHSALLTAPVIHWVPSAAWPLTKSNMAR